MRCAALGRHDARVGDRNPGRYRGRGARGVRLSFGRGTERALVRTRRGRDQAEHEPGRPHGGARRIDCPPARRGAFPFGDAPFTIDNIMIPIDHQPAGYWATNLYATPRKRPKSDAPLKDLPSRAAQRFKRAREGIRALRHVTEQVVFMGTAWKWVWMYEVGGRKLGVTDGLPRTSRQAIRDGRMAGGVRWCWMEFPDFDAVDAFVSIIRLKHQLLARPE